MYGKYRQRFFVCVDGPEYPFGERAKKRVVTYSRAVDRRIVRLLDH